MRTCRLCKKEKPIDQFKLFKHGTNWRRKVCDDCRKEQEAAYREVNQARMRAYKKRWHQENKEAVIDRVNKWVSENPDKRKQNARNYYFRLQHAAIMAYGGYECACCGETEPMFLTIDHVNDDGAKHRKKLGSLGGARFYKDLRDKNYPPGFQVLCSNCNHGRHRNGGVCPHKEGVTTIPKGSRAKRPEAHSPRKG